MTRNSPASPLARQIVALMAAAVVSFGATGCDDDIIEPAAGLRVSGTVFYEGAGFDNFAEPAMQVAVFSAFPPISVPHGFIVVENPEFTAAGISYEVTGVPAWDGGYQVIGQIVDQTNLADMSGPTGAFPDFCQLSAAEGGLVTVAEDEPTTGIDITLFDSGGATDPCANNTDACPGSAGQASLVVDLTSEVDPGTFTDTDTVFIGLFATFPGPPSAFRIVPRADIEFPLQVILNETVPDDYVVFACYDRMGDNLMDCGDGEGDVAAFYDSQTPVTLAADTITTLGLDIDSGDSEGAEVVTAQDAGCDL